MHPRKYESVIYLPEIRSRMTPTVYKDGTRIWYDCDRERHRDHGLPAVIYPNGTREWWSHGKRHREGDLPVIVRTDGSKAWLKTRADGFDIFYRDGNLPAVVCPDGSLAWYVNGNCHRENGLACRMEADGVHWWSFRGRRVTDFTEWNVRFMFVMRCVVL